MAYILSSDQMKALDQRTTTELGIPSQVLMETAGKGAADYLHSNHSKELSGSIAIFCGSGNNGGDGYVIARWLDYYGYRVTIFSIGEGNSSPETIANKEACHKLNIPFIPIICESDVHTIPILLDEYSIIIDAMFGVGFRGMPSQMHQELFEALNLSPAFKVAIDIPSGINASTSEVFFAFKANLTLCIEAIKYGHLIGAGRAFCGQLKIIPIGIPKSYYTDINAATLIDDNSCCYPQRDPLSNKSHYGKAFLFAGSGAYSGAALLAAKAALRSGAGYVYLFQRPELKEFYRARIPETICIDIPQSESDSLPDEAKLLSLLEGAGAVLIGPGFGTDDFALYCLKIILSHITAPILIDADAITLISRNKELYKYLGNSNILLSPHVGEFLRLADCSKADFVADPMLQIHSFCARYNAQVLVKNHSTIFHDNSRTLVSIAGNDGLATGGSGDVLSGVITSFLAQGMPLHLAAINASFLCGKTAELLAKTRVPASITPSDIAENLFLRENHNA